MEETKFIWMDGKLVPWAEAKVHVLTHSLHYGSAAFEGIRAYKTDQGTAIFRLDAHIDRLFASAKVLGMSPAYTTEQVCIACRETLKINALEQGYIRPLMFYGAGVMGVHPKNAPIQLAIACWPWGAYLPHDLVDLKISRYIRIHPQSCVTEAKICGHYVNSLLAVMEVRNEKYHEALLLDFNGNIAEGPGENFFMVKGSKLYTPKLGTILAGITRATILCLSKDLGIEVLERDIKPEEAFAADEAFYTGTATEVAPIRSIDDHQIGNGQVGPLTAKLRKLYLDTVAGRVAKYSSWLS